VPDMFTPAPKASTTSQAAPSVSSPSSLPSSSATARSSPLPASSSSAASSSPPPANLVDPATGRFNLNIAVLPDSESVAVARPAVGDSGAETGAAAPATGGPPPAAAAALPDGRRGLGSLSWLAVVLVAVLVGVGKLGSNRWA
jgi:hypothetical protein